MQYFIREDIFEKIFKILIRRSDIRSGNKEKLKVFIEAIHYRLRSGCQWRLLPSCYGKWQSVYRRFLDWNKKRIWEKLFQSCQSSEEEELKEVMVDGTIVRAHACSSGYGKNSQEIQALGRSKGGFTTKIHALVNGLGLPLKFILTGGQRNEITQALGLLEGISYTTVLADKGYDSNGLVSLLEERNCLVVIPPRSNRKNPRVYDQELYKERHLIECFFGKMKHFRGIFSRFDKMKNVYLSFLCLAGALLWLR